MVLYQQTEKKVRKIALFLGKQGDFLEFSETESGRIPILPLERRFVDGNL